MVAVLSQPGRATHWPVIGAVVGAGIVASLQVGKVAIAAPMLQTELGLDLASVGWLTGVFALLGLVGGIPAGTIIAGAGDRRIMAFGLFAVFLGAAFGAVAPSFPALVASRVIEGLGFLLITVAGPAILRRVVVAGQRDIAFALWSCFMPAGMAIAMSAGPLFGDWRTLWWCSAGVAGVAMIAIAILVPRAETGKMPSWRNLVTDALAVLGKRGRGPQLLAACFALYSLMFFALFSFLPVLLMQRMGVAHETAGLLSALATGANIIGNLAAGYLLARGVGRPALIVCASIVMGVSALGIFLPVFADTPTFLLCLVFSAVGGLIPATLLSSASVIASSAMLAPIVIGLIMQGSNLGQIVGPVAIGAAIDAHGWPAAAVAVLVAAILASLIALALGKHFERGEES
ncbi:MFS transporter [Paramesorhizobium deserti]|uniref:MFS transporter n=1 Tax=Paramesorhizobium deserti TaxID=1494590 RepID=A0A135HPI8_9HYPH|nr:MFS transporter [Paramesorhizobium deserti]KXF75109.1 MFS transporter [Paramesorhizobium deserti]